MTCNKETPFSKVSDPYQDKEDPFTAKSSSYTEKDDYYNRKESPYEDTLFCVLLQENNFPILQENNKRIIL